LDARAAPGRYSLAAVVPAGREPTLLVWQHHLSPPIFDATGDGIHTHTDVYVPKLFRGEAGEVCILHTGGRYHDELVATSRGWRIARRRFENTWAMARGSGR
jgi:hypothetical protein